MEDRLRTLLRDLADDVGPQIEVPSRMLVRARRRTALTVGGGVLAVTLLALGSLIGARALLTAQEPQPAEPAPAPDATGPPVATDKIAFISDRDGHLIDLRNATTDIYVMNADGTDVVRLTDDSTIKSSPAWSPDGTRIAFTSWPYPSGQHAYVTKDRDIYVMNADGNDVVRLTDDHAVYSFPAWSPDGKRIAFARTPASSPDGTSRGCCYTDIYVMNADGTDVVRLTDNPAFDHSPTWAAPPA